MTFYERMANALNIDEARQAATDYLDFVYYWNLQPGVVNAPFSVYYDSNVIAAWPMPRSVSSPIDGVWDLKMR